MIDCALVKCKGRDLCNFESCRRPFYYRKKTGYCETCGQMINVHGVCRECGILVGGGHIEETKRGGLCKACYTFSRRKSYATRL
jgi:hypothetical protein